MTSWSARISPTVQAFTHEDSINQCLFAGPYYFLESERKRSFMGERSYPACPAASTISAALMFPFRPCIIAQAVMERVPDRQ